MQVYSQNEIEEIHLAFDGIHGRGLLQAIVSKESEGKVSLMVDEQDLSLYFSSRGFEGITKLINILLLLGKAGEDQFGSHCIDFYGIMNAPFSLKNAETLVGVTIGNAKKKMTPLEWITYLRNGFDGLSEIQKSGFDNVCNDFAELRKALASGEGVREITPEELEAL